MTARDAARRLRATAAKLERNLGFAVQNTVQDAYATARRLSEGQVSSASLARMDHPFARRHGSPRLNPAIINVQSGAFRAGWRQEDAAEVDGDLRGRVYNVAPVARYLEAGTERMFARPLPEAVLAEVEPRFRRRLAYAAEAALKP